ncbi:hypothetical protein [Clostridium perfringens]|uniref:hypothetical protein n=1 Tax=Clostridium perfringens TaxID=1502 RepID=UPI00024964CF|nr:hypothetical protein [Clostridium perfringens]EHP47354.1 hypothetical protein HMPREF9476_02093 [Clostridium perfringens WAL-14572]
MNKNMEMMKKLIEEKKNKGKNTKANVRAQKNYWLCSRGEERATMVEDYLINNI